MRKIIGIVLDQINLLTRTKCGEGNFIPINSYRGLEDPVSRKEIKSWTITIILIINRGIKCNENRIEL